VGQLKLHQRQLHCAFNCHQANSEIIIYSPSVLYFSIKGIQSACVEKIAFDTALMTTDMVIIHEIKTFWSKMDKISEPYPSRFPNYASLLRARRLQEIC